MKPFLIRDRVGLVHMGLKNYYAYGGSIGMTKILSQLRSHLRISVLVGFICIGLSSACLAETTSSPANGLLIRVDWQDPWLLPREFRNHCYCDSRGRYY